MFDGFTALANDQTDLVTRDDNFTETASTTVLASHTRGSAGRTIALVGNDVINCGFRVTENKLQILLL